MFMRILAINCGSSPLKYQVIEAHREEKAGDRELPIASEVVGIGCVFFRSSEERTTEVTFAEHLRVK